MMQFGKGIYIMNQTKIQDVIRHISKDEDYGVDMMEKLSLADAVEVMAVVLPSLKKRAKEMGNTNDLAYFGRIEEIYAKVIADKFADVIATKNKGQIMKTIMPEFKGKADGKVINQVVAKLCQ